MAAADVPVLGNSASGTVTPDGGGVINYTGVEAVRTPLIYQAPGAAELTLSFNETDDELDLFDAEEESVLASATNKAISSISEVRIIGSSEADALTLNASFNRPVWFDGGSGSVADMLLGPDEDNTWEITSANEGSLNSHVSFTGVEKLVGGLDDDLFLVRDDGTGATTIDVAGVRTLTTDESDDGQDRLGVFGIAATDNDPDSPIGTVTLGDGPNRISYDGFEQVATRLSYQATGPEQLALGLDDPDAENPKVQVVGASTVEKSLATTSEVIVSGSSAPDTLTIDVSLPSALAVTFDGQGDDDTLVGPDVLLSADASDQPLWRISGDNAGASTTPSNLSASKT